MGVPARSLGARHNPLRTEQILSLTERVDLSQHNYTVFLESAGAAADPAGSGSVAAFNVVYLSPRADGAVHLRAGAARDSATRCEAWLAGVAFAWSPVLVARSTGHFSLVAAAPLAAFRAVPDQRRPIATPARCRARRLVHGLGGASATRTTPSTA